MRKEWPRRFRPPRPLTSPPLVAPRKVRAPARALARRCRPRRAQAPAAAGRRAHAGRGRRSRPTAPPRRRRRPAAAGRPAAARLPRRAGPAAAPRAPRRRPRAPPTPPARAPAPRRAPRLTRAPAVVKYSPADRFDGSKTAKTRGNHVRVHYKHTREIMHAIKGMELAKAQQYLRNVLDKKQAIPVTVYTGGYGRHAQGKSLNASGSKVFWPQKATKEILNLLVNVESNAESKQLEVDGLRIIHAQANRAPKQRRRTYRAHGRIGPYMASPAHLEIMVGSKDALVRKADDGNKGTRLNRKRLAQKRDRVPVGGGVDA